MNFWSTKLPLRVWLKLNELIPWNPTGTGVKEGVELTPPATVLTHVTPHVTSKVSDGFIADNPTIRTTTLTLTNNGLVTIAVQI